MGSTIPTSGSPDEERALIAKAQGAYRAWQHLALRICAITPRAALRLALIASAIITSVWLIWQAWNLLLPFQIGLILAYLLAPTVNRLSRWMPRRIASMLVFGSVMLGLVVGVGSIVPPLVAQLTGVVNALPSTEQIGRWLQDLGRYIESLPPATRIFVSESVTGALTGFRDQLVTYLQGLIGVLLGGALSLLNTFTFVLGFLVVPFWLYYVIKDQSSAFMAINRALPDWMQDDFWAMVRIVDRVVSSYLRGQIVLALVVALLTFSGLHTLGVAGFRGIEYVLLLAVITGIAELIPYLGPLLAVIVAALIGATASWEASLAMAIVVFTITQLVNTFLYPIVVGKSLQMHEAVLIIVLIVLSQFGLVWVILAGPVAGIARDLFRYLLGRLSDPPRPAGLLPGEPLPQIPHEASDPVVPLAQSREVGW